MSKRSKMHFSTIIGYAFNNMIVIFYFKVLTTSTLFIVMARSEKKVHWVIYSSPRIIHNISFGKDIICIYFSWSDWKKHPFHLSVCVQCTLNKIRFPVVFSDTYLLHLQSVQDKPLKTVQDKHLSSVLNICT